MTIGVVISTSTNEIRFLKAQLQECVKFATEIVVVIGSHRYDGITKEPIEAYYEIITTFPSVNFTLYNVTPPGTFHNPLTRRPDAYWHNYARIVGVKQLSRDLNWIMFLDGDEIPEGELMRDWIANILPSKTNLIGFTFANYWYYREPTFQATTTEDSVIMVKNSLFDDNNVLVNILMNDAERFLFKMLQNVEYNIKTNNGDIMIHHYSWVRTKEQILKKVANWGHSHDKPWAELIEASWENPFDGRDFVHGYEYQIVQNRFGI